LPTITGSTTANPSFTASKAPGSPAETLLLNVQAKGSDGKIYKGSASSFLVDFEVPITVPAGAEVGKDVLIHAQPSETGGTFQWVVKESNLVVQAGSGTADLTVKPNRAGQEKIVLVWTKAAGGGVGVGVADLVIIDPNNVLQGTSA